MAFRRAARPIARARGGVYVSDESEPSGAGPAPPELPAPARAAEADEDDGGGIAPWLFPLLGVVIAGAGFATLRARR